VYTALHAHIIAVGRARGDVVGVRLYVEPDNERARRTYEKLGMTKTYDVMEQKV
jgi:ribosomal protein S18 acetylase RimI-like enzyme